MTLLPTSAFPPRLSRSVHRLIPDPLAVSAVSHPYIFDAADLLSFDAIIYRGYIKVFDFSRTILAIVQI